MNSKICTSIEQSKKLIELGIDINTADIMWTALNWQETEYYMEVKNEGFDMPKKYIPAWSLSALLDLMICPNLEEYIKSKWDLTTFTDESLKTPIEIQDYENPIDACVEMILKLNELKML